MTITKEHRRRIKEELKSAGVTNYGLLKPESRNLPQIIQEDEHIKGVIYGRATTGGGAMLIATDLRLIYFNRMPLFSTLDEIPYERVSGITRGKEGGLLVAVTLHTRIGDYTIRFANLNCASTFVKYIERKCIEIEKDGDLETKFETEAELADVFLNSEERQFIDSHEVATLSTIDRRGNVDGAVVYYTTFDDGLMYVLTKGGTQKVHNIFAHPQVAFTIYDEQTLQTLQMQGIAKIETEATMKNKVFKAIMHKRDYKGEMRLPPVAQLQNESFMIVRIHPTTTRFRDYKNFSFERSYVTGNDLQHSPVY